MNNLLTRIQQFLFRTLNPTGWRVEQLTEGLSPEQREVLTNLKEQVSAYYAILHSKSGFGHLANTEPLVKAMIAVATAIASAVEARIPSVVIEHHTPPRFHRAFMHTGSTSS